MILLTNPGGSSGAAATDALIPIARTVLAAPAASIAFANIPQTYENLRLVLMGRSNKAAASGDAVNLRFNGDTGANYNATVVETRNVTTTGYNYAATNQQYLGTFPAATATANRPGMLEIDIPAYARAVFHKVLMARSEGMTDGSTNRFFERLCALWASAAAITDITVYVSDNFAIGTVATLYGMKGA